MFLQIVPLICYTNKTKKSDHAYLSSAKGSSAGTTKSLSSFPVANLGWISRTAFLRKLNVFKNSRLTLHFTLYRIVTHKMHSSNFGSFREQTVIDDAEEYYVWEFKNFFLFTHKKPKLHNR